MTDHVVTTEQADARHAVRVNGTKVFTFADKRRADHLAESLRRALGLTPTQQKGAA